MSDDTYTDGRNSILGGNQVNAPITAPVNIEGIAAAILGQPEQDAEADAEKQG